uniref:Neurotoxin E1x n=2 Tax=Centruroides sculpturatus TaxID=218467 RepID=SCXX_CENSC|nr:RecName: Full=Neurotoxin E1x; AltName: Full=CsE1x; Flags: Precursor [Centruroides sculpturatus]AAL23416.1 sodium-channel modifier toxin precursor CsE1x [Centruroides exilicauda]
MNSLLMITACLVVIGTVWAKEGYLVDVKGCKKNCWKLGDNDYCNRECKWKHIGGSYGYCYGFGCYCEGLPDSTQTWPLPNKTCGKK